MTTPMKTLGLAMAVSAAGIFAASGVAAAGDGHAKGKEAKVHCYGVNACKGHNDCKTEMNACKGQGSCKGQGFLSMSAEECAKKGGKVKKDK
ncbi:hypothetical protein [Paremcibacter congregatus]|uniref:BufA2 family periplasmic bufferin-type metallophore n=1 Tax=Paremcibacter congregatus TaxID=2043170 RepID=UPI003A9155EA